MKTCTVKSHKSTGHARDGLFEVIHPNAAGIDVGASEMWVCVPEGRAPERVRKFGTDTTELEAIANWLAQCGVASVAMESTGVYWIPLFQILENHGMEVCLVNARHVKNVPGRRKTDRLDCQWLQKLHACGLMSASFRPSAEICRLRTCLRHRYRLVGEQATHIQRMHKALREMNVLLDQAVSDVTGLSGMRILDAIVSGQQDPNELAKLADKRVRKKPEEIARCLHGDYRPEHIFVLSQELEAYRFYAGQVRECDRQVEQYTELLVQLYGHADAAVPEPTPERPGKRKRHHAPAGDVRTSLCRLTGVDLTAVPGIAELTAQGMVAETGIDMSRWPSDKHFVSWLALCPNPKVSGGQVIGQGRRQAASRAAQLLRQAASSLKNSDTWLGSFYRRMRGRLGGCSAVKATARKLAMVYYRMLSTHSEYRQIDTGDYEERFRQRMIRNLRRRAHQLGMEVTPGAELPATACP